MFIVDFFNNLVHVDPVSLVALCLGIAALVVAICAFRRAGKRRDIAVVLQCLAQYSDVRKVRANAILTSSQALAEVYYAHLFDLMWVEFKMWVEGFIPDGMMLEWMNARYLDCAQNDGILTARVGPAGRTVRRVSYREEWTKRELAALPRTPRASFLEFMDIVHEGHMQEALRLKRSLRRNLSRAPEFEVEEDRRGEAANGERGDVPTVSSGAANDAAADAPKARAEAAADAGAKATVPQDARDARDAREPLDKPNDASAVG